MPPGPRGNFENGLQAAEPMRVWYTGYQLDGTTPITDELYKGAVVCFVPEASGTGTSKGQGIDVTQPEDGTAGDNISLVAGVVKEFDATTGAQWITITPRVQNTVVNASTLADMDPVTPTFLVATSGEFHLTAATITGGGTTLKEVFDPCATALDDADTSGAAANQAIMWR